MTYIPTIYTGRLANDAVTSAKILNGEIVNADISASAAIAYSKLALSNSIVSADIVNGTIVAADTTISLAQLAAQTASAGDITASSQKITNLADGVNPNDAVNYSQLTAVSNGIVDWKSSVRLVSTANLDLSGAETIDGVATAPGDRVLAVGQTAADENGIYVVAAGAWARSTDADTSAEVTSGMAVSVTEGTTYDNSLWLLSTNDPIVLDTTNLSFIQLPSLNDLLAGAGLTKTGSTVDVGQGIGMTVNANDVAIDTAVVPRKAVDNVFTGNNTFAGMNLAVTSTSANNSINAGVDNVQLVDTTGGPVTITLPASHTVGDWFTVKDAGGAAATNAITVDPADADTIDGAATYSIASNYEAITVISNGTNWFII